MGVDQGSGAPCAGSDEGLRFAVWHPNADPRIRRSFAITTCDAAKLVIRTVETDFARAAPISAA